MRPRVLTVKPLRVLQHRHYENHFMSVIVSTWEPKYSIEAHSIPQKRQSFATSKSSDLTVRERISILLKVTVQQISPRILNSSLTG